MQYALIDENTSEGGRDSFDFYDPRTDLGIDGIAKTTGTITITLG